MTTDAPLKDGDTCQSPGCSGELMQVPVDDCTCWKGHPPCLACTTPNLVCVACGEIST